MLYKKITAVACAAFLMIGLSSCASNESTVKVGKGAASPEEAAEIYVKGLFDASELVLTVVPNSYLEYLEDEYYITQELLTEKVTSYLATNYGTPEFTSFEISGKSTFQQMQDLNEAFSEINVEKASDAYEIDLAFQTSRGDNENMDITVFSCKNKWYSWEAMMFVEYVAEHADEIYIVDWDSNVTTSIEAISEMYIKGCFKSTSYFCDVVPEYLVTYLTNKHNISETEIKQKVSDLSNDPHELYYNRCIGSELRNFQVKNYAICELSEKSLHELSIIGMAYDIAYSVNIEFNTDYEPDSDGQWQMQKIIVVIKSDSQYYVLNAFDVIESALTDKNIEFTNQTDILVRDLTHEDVYS